MEQKKSFNNIVYMFAVIYAILGILFIFIKYPTTDPQDPVMKFLGVLGLFFFIGTIVLAVWYYKKQGYPLTLGKAVKLGVLVGLLGGFIVAVYAYFYFTYIDPGKIDILMELSRKKLESHEELTPEMIDQQMEIIGGFFKFWLIIAEFLVGAIYGVIGGLLGGLFFKTPTEDY